MKPTPAKLADDRSTAYTKYCFQHYENKRKYLKLSPYVVEPAPGIYRLTYH